MAMGEASSDVRRVSEHEPPPEKSREGDDEDDGPSAPEKSYTPKDGDMLANGNHHRSTLKERIIEKKDKIRAKAKPPGGFDTTPLPDAPPGYTVKFTFHKASNLPAADLVTGSADPFLTATLRTSAPKRHKEDPELRHRTRTIRRSTEPEWVDEWIVANVPQSGFTLKCRLYDEDLPDHNDRLGNVTIRAPRIDENWKGYPPPGTAFEVKKRVGSKRAYFVKWIASCLDRSISLTPTLFISIQVLGKSDPPHAQVYTAGPSVWIKHCSPMIGRLAGTKVHKNEEHDVQSQTGSNSNEKRTKRHDFQANEMQLAGPVPPELYHRYVEFRPAIGLMFSSSGVRGKILNKALHKQHERIYSFDKSTEFGRFEPCSEEASLLFLRLAHFDEGGRIFTYVLTLDGMFRFTETGTEFGIDLLSKHTMHSDVETYVACAGEFFIRRLEKPDASEDPEPKEATHPVQEIPGGPPEETPPRNPSFYQLIIDNDSGTYRPDKSILPLLKQFLQRNFPGLGIVTLHCQDEELAHLKDAQRQTKKKEGHIVNMVMNRSPSSSSMSSHESALERMERRGDDEAKLKSTREKAYDMLEEPRRLKDALGEASKQL